VCGTGCASLTLSGFSGRDPPTTSGASSAPRHPPPGCVGSGLPWTPPATGEPVLSMRPASHGPRVPASLQSAGAGLSTCSPSPTLVDQPRLRTRLTLGRLPLPRNPQACGVGSSHPQCATHSDIRASVRSTSAPALASPLLPNAPLPRTSADAGPLAASVDRLSPGTFSARRHSTSELLRTL
jgi:hypothetical protein